MSSQARNREECTWCRAFAHGSPFDEGSTSRERQSGGAGAALSEAGHLFLSEEK